MHIYIYVYVYIYIYISIFENSIVQTFENSLSDIRQIDCAYTFVRIRCGPHLHCADIREFVISHVALVRTHCVGSQRYLPKLR